MTSSRAATAATAAALAFSERSVRLGQTRCKLARAFRWEQSKAIKG